VQDAITFRLAQLEADAERNGMAISDGALQGVHARHRGTLALSGCAGRATVHATQLPGCRPEGMCGGMANGMPKTIASVRQPDRDRGWRDAAPSSQRYPARSPAKG